MTSSHDVADELRRRLPDLGKLKLHKLLYYAAGWHLAWTGKQLFDEPTQAWRNGPVVAKLWADEEHGRQRPRLQPLGDSQLATIDYVIERYQNYSGHELIRMTHEEDPWRDVIEAEPPIEAGGTDVITPVALQAWFKQDDEFIRYRSEADRLLKQLGDDPFALPSRDAELSSAIKETIAGKKVRRPRPA